MNLINTDNKYILSLCQGDYSRDVLMEALLASGDSQEQMFSLAQEYRLKNFPDNRAQVRSVIEISNVCKQKCRYCAIGGSNQALNFTLKSDVIVELMNHLIEKGRTTILLQSGEHSSDEFVPEVREAIKRIKDKHPEIRIILCLGDLTEDEYQDLYDAGASDYILKFETSNPDLFTFCKPNDTLEHRLNCIRVLAKIGYRVGSGNIVGLPGQTLEDLVNDLILAHELPLKMNSTTIFIPAENSDFSNEPAGDGNMTLNMMALLRIMNPTRLMPTTSSLEKMIPDGQYLGLCAGANTVTIHDGTPEHLQKHFPIYSTKRIRPQMQHFKDILTKAGMKTDNLL